MEARVSPPDEVQSVVWSACSLHHRRTFYHFRFRSFRVCHKLKNISHPSFMMKCFPLSRITDSLQDEKYIWEFNSIVCTNSKKLKEHRINNCTFITKVAPFKRKFNRLSNNLRFVVLNLYLCSCRLLLHRSQQGGVVQKEARGEEEGAGGETGRT